MVRVKICGLTRAPDVQAAAAAGADAIGFVFAPSPRRVDPELAGRLGRHGPPFLVKVGVFVDPTLDFVARTAQTARLHVIQLHGREDDDFIRAVADLGYTVVKAGAVRRREDAEALAAAPADGVLLDGYDPRRAGGTGLTFDWRLAAAAGETLARRRRAVPLILAGGLTPDNVAEAVRTVRPYAVDVSSGVEAEPGVKCAQKMKRFVKRARSFRDVDA